MTSWFLLFHIFTLLLGCSVCSLSRKRAHSSVDSVRALPCLKYDFWYHQISPSCAHIFFFFFIFFLKWRNLSRILLQSVFYINKMLLIQYFFFLSLFSLVFVFLIFIWRLMQCIYHCFFLPRANHSSLFVVVAIVVIFFFLSVHTDEIALISRRFYYTS